MNIGFMIYLLSMVDRLHCLVGILGVLLLIALFIIFVCFTHSYGEEDENRCRRYIKTWRNCVFVWLLPFAISFFTPDSRTMAAIYLVPKITDAVVDSELAKIPDKAMKVLNLKMDEWIESFEDEK